MIKDFKSFIIEKEIFGKLKKARSKFYSSRDKHLPKPNSLVKDDNGETYVIVDSFLIERNPIISNQKILHGPENKLRSFYESYAPEYLENITIEELLNNHKGEIIVAVHPLNPELWKGMNYNIYNQAYITVGFYNVQTNKIFF